MRAAGHDIAAIPAIARDPQQVLGFIEVHIEQGPVLLDAGQPLGVVTSIAGNIRNIVRIEGLAGHAGTVPMPLRRDAAAAAAEMVLAVERRCSAVAGLVGTVGKLEVPGGAINVIPGRCEFSVDIRSGSDALRDAAVSGSRRRVPAHREPARGYARATAGARGRERALHAGTAGRVGAERATSDGRRRAAPAERRRT